MILILRCQSGLVFTLHPSIVKLLTSFMFHMQIADEIFAFSYCIVSSKRYGACVIKLTNLLWLVCVLSLQCSLLAHFHPCEGMGQTKEEKKNESERSCSFCSFINFCHLKIYMNIHIRHSKWLTDSALMFFNAWNRLVEFKLTFNFRRLSKQTIR